jgi:hypothetical protein
VIDVTVDESTRPLVVIVRYEARKTNAKKIGNAAKKALESEANNSSPVKVVYRDDD